MEKEIKVLVWSDMQKIIEKSGVGRARNHQIMALKAEGISYTLNQYDDYDIIHINTIFPQSLIMAEKARREGKAVIYHAHSTEEDFRNSFVLSNIVSPYFKSWLEKCYSTSDLVLTPTEYSKNLLENYNIDVPIRVISNGIDLDYWKASDKEIENFKEKYGYNQDDKIIMSVGLQIKRKGIIEFVEMAKKMPDYQFIWFGHTNQTILPEEVQNAVNTKLPNLTFAGYVSRDELRVAYRASDLYIFPTHEETEGIVLLEALASKTKTLVRDIPVFDYYKDTVHLYKAKDTEEFIDKAKKILSNELPDVTEEGYKLAENKSIKNVGKKLRKYYEEAIELSKMRLK